MKCSFVRAVSSPHVDYIAIPHWRVNANKANGRERFGKWLFPVGSGFAETEPTEIRPEQPADAEQGAPRRVGIIGNPEQAG